MFSRRLYLLLGLGTAALLACGSTKAVAPVLSDPNPVVLQDRGPANFSDWGHLPLRCPDFAGLTFYVDATAEAGVSRVELYAYEYELYVNPAGLPSQRRRVDGVWGRLADLPQPVGREAVEATYTHREGFGPHTRLEYIWRITDADGAITERLGITDVGTSPWPQDKVLLFAASRAPMSDLIDIAFFRDTDYGDDRLLYDRDVEAMVTRGFLGAEPFRANRDLWAFYTTDRSADGKALAQDIGNDALLPAFLKDFSIPGIDAFCLLHREDYTDRSLLLENFHSLSNNMFSAEAQNWGTAVHECGHAIFHLSDEYDGCACFQSHSGSNVFREQSDCVAWNLSNGFPAGDCFELSDVYSRSWWSAEEPTFFETAAACQEHNISRGLSPDSCRTFIDELGDEKFWSFESTCIMHDDGDHEVRSFQRACRRVIDDQFTAMRGRARRGFLAGETGPPPFRENIFGYEPVLQLDMHRSGDDWSLELRDVTMGVPTAEHQGAGEVRMRVVDAAGKSLANYRLANAGAVHAHGEEDRYEVPREGTVRIAVPASSAIERVICEYDLDAHGRGADGSLRGYSEGFLFDIGPQTRALMATPR